MATSAIIRADSRRAALRRRLDARYPLLADQFYQQDIQRHRAYFSGQQVPAPTHPRRRRPASRPTDRKALEAFRARQMDLLAWKRPGPVRRILGAIGRILRGIRGKMGWPTTTKGRTMAAPITQPHRHSRSGGR